MLRILLILLLFQLPVANKLLLKDDLKRDRAMLNEHGTYMDKAEKVKLKIFDKYADLDLSGFKFSKKKVGKHIISKWNGGKGKPCIYQVETILHVDTLLDDTFISVDSARKPVKDNVAHKIPVKGDFKFRTYIIDVPNKKRLVYLTQQGAGLIHFSIGGKSYSPVHEDIMYGVIYPDMNEIKRLIKISKKRNYR
jgi:hypothetical protein